MGWGKRSSHWLLSTIHVLTRSLDGNDPYIFLIVPCPLQPTRDFCYQIVYKSTYMMKKKSRGREGEEEQEGVKRKKYTVSYNGCGCGQDTICSLRAMLNAEYQNHIAGSQTLHPPPLSAPGISIMKEKGDRLSLGFTQISIQPFFLITIFLHCLSYFSIDVIEHHDQGKL